MNYKLILTEDNNFLAESIKEKLKLFDDVELLYSAVNGNDLLNKLEKNSSADVILMDIEMPLMDGIQAAAAVSEKYPHIKVIMLTVFDDDEKIFRAVQAGAMGYLLKDESAVSIYEAVKIVMQGGASMSPVIAAKSLALLRIPFVEKDREKEPAFVLSSRETDVLELLSKGLNYNEIGNKLYISPFTVRKHIENIYRKLQVNNKVQAIQKASQHRLI